MTQKRDPEEQYGIVYWRDAISITHDGQITQVSQLPLQETWGRIKRYKDGAKTIVQILSEHVQNPMPGRDVDDTGTVILEDYIERIVYLKPPKEARKGKL